MFLSNAYSPFQMWGNLRSSRILYLSLFPRGGKKDRFYFPLFTSSIWIDFFSLALPIRARRYTAYCWKTFSRLPFLISFKPWINFILPSLFLHLPGEVSRSNLLTYFIDFFATKSDFQYGKPMASRSEPGRLYDRSRRLDVSSSLKVFQGPSFYW